MAVRGGKRKRKRRGKRKGGGGLESVEVEGRIAVVARVRSWRLPGGPGTPGSGSPKCPRDTHRGTPWGDPKGTTLGSPQDTLFGTSPVLPRGSSLGVPHGFSGGTWGIPRDPRGTPRVPPEELQRFPWCSRSGCFPGYPQCVPSPLGAPLGQPKGAPMGPIGDLGVPPRTALRVLWKNTGGYWEFH